MFNTMYFKTINIRLYFYRNEKGGTASTSSVKESYRVKIRRRHKTNTDKIK